MNRYAELSLTLVSGALLNHILVKNLLHDWKAKDRILLDT